MTAIEAPVFQATHRDLQTLSFAQFVEAHEPDFLQAGVCKIRPPRGWTPRRGGYGGLNFTISRPIRQHATGKQGLYRTILVESKAMTLKQFKAMADDPLNAPPPQADLETLERKYWKNVVLNPPLYGADVPGSLFDEDCKAWNLAHLESLLSQTMAAHGGACIPGVNTPYLYVGSWRSTFAWHTEDLDLHSVNYLHFGAPKTWYVVPPAHRARFELLMQGLLPELFRVCPEFLRHKELVVSPSLLQAHGIPFTRLEQQPGEFVVTYPGAYHCGFNQGYNCAESVNFATRTWVDIGAVAGSCQCRQDSVRIDMRMFADHMSPRLREEWLAPSSESGSEEEEEEEGSEWAGRGGSSSPGGPSLASGGGEEEEEEEAPDSSAGAASGSLGGSSEGEEEEEEEGEDAGVASDSDSEYQQPGPKRARAGPRPTVGRKRRAPDPSPEPAAGQAKRRRQPQQRGAQRQPQPQGQPGSAAPRGRGRPPRSSAAAAAAAGAAGRAGRRQQQQRQPPRTPVVGARQAVAVAAALSLGKPARPKAAPGTAGGTPAGGPSDGRAQRLRRRQEKSGGVWDARAERRLRRDATQQQAEKAGARGRGRGRGRRGLPGPGGAAAGGAGAAVEEGVGADKAPAPAPAGLGGEESLGSGGLAASDLAVLGPTASIVEEVGGAVEHVGERPMAGEAELNGGGRAGANADEGGASRGGGGRRLLGVVHASVAGVLPVLGKRMRGMGTAVGPP